MGEPIRLPLQPLFPLGRVLATPGALALMDELNISGAALLRRHVTGDWGDIQPDDRGLNEEALRAGSRILSVYGTSDERLWIITEADRSYTTILRPEDY
jgi:hypothetical protein